MTQEPLEPLDQTAIPDPKDPLAQTALEVLVVFKESPDKTVLMEQTEPEALKENKETKGLVALKETLDLKERRETRGTRETKVIPEIVVEEGEGGTSVAPVLNDNGELAGLTIAGTTYSIPTRIIYQPIDSLQERIANYFQGESDYVVSPWVRPNLRSIGPVDTYKPVISARYNGKVNSRGRLRQSAQVRAVVSVAEDTRYRDGEGLEQLQAELTAHLNNVDNSFPEQANTPVAYEYKIGSRPYIALLFTVFTAS